MHNNSLTVIILTYNEERHIKRCINSISSFIDEIIVVDSYSDDKTITIARELGARVIEHKFTNYAHQLNWTIENVPIHSSWVMRLDADEYPSIQLAEALQNDLKFISLDIAGLVVNRRIIFSGKLIRFGGFGYNPMLRIWKNGSARCESRWMDEHMVLSYGNTQKLPGELIDENLNNITWWTQKHIKYASREAIDMLNLRHGFLKKNDQCQIGPAKFKRSLKENVYSKLPLGLRSILYFFFRMVCLGGVLDGPRGWTFNFLQGLWYRLLIDIKIREVENRMYRDGCDVVNAIIAECGINPLDLE